MKHTLLGIIAAAVSVTAAIIAVVAIKNYSEKKKALEDDDFDDDYDYDDDCGCDYDECEFDEYDFDEDFSCEDECDIDDFEDGKDLDDLLDEEAAAGAGTERGLRVRRAIAALVERGAGAVKKNGDLILSDGKADFILLSGLRETIHMPALLHALYNGFFDNALAVGNGKKRGIEAIPGDGEGGIQGEKLVPGEGVRALKQLVKASRGKTAKFQKNALSAAERDIDRSAVRERALKEDASVFRLDLLHVHSAQLIRNKTFQTE